MSRTRYFGTDGIRDVAGEGMLADERVRELGRAVGAFLSGQREGARVLVGRDTRASGPGILGGLADGILASGHELIDGGVLTTPAIQSLCREEGFDLAVVISASHNPAQDNGIKFFGPDGRKLADAHQDALEDLMDRARGGDLDVPEANGNATTPTADPKAGGRYVDWLTRTCLEGLDLKDMGLVLDCAHGAGWELGPELLGRLGGEPEILGAAPDGNNINDGAGVFFLDRLAERVKESGAALGLALDGDADRVLLVDETGTVRDGDHMLGVLAADLASRDRLEGNRVVTTVMANLGLVVFLRERGITCDMVPVGDRFVAARMAETGAVLGGEQSGHVIFREGERWFGDGLYTALRVIDVMRRTGRPLSELAAGVEKFPQTLINVRVREKPPLEELEPLMNAKADVEARLGDEGRVLLRYSGTEKLLRVMVEGRDGAGTTAMAEELAEVVRGLLGA